jgi:hypothetical protein
MRATAFTTSPTTKPRLCSGRPGTPLVHVLAEIDGVLVVEGPASEAEGQAVRGHRARLRVPVGGVVDVLQHVGPSSAATAAFGSRRRRRMAQCELRRRAPAVRGFGYRNPRRCGLDAYPTRGGSNAVDLDASGSVTLERPPSAGCECREAATPGCSSTSDPRGRV